MKIVCPKCRANYEVALPPLGEAGIELKCAVCHHPFRIKKKTSKPPPSQRATGAAPDISVPAKLPEHPSMDDVSAALPRGMQSLDDSAVDVPDPFDFDDESLNLDLPDEVTAAGSMELLDLPETKDWDEVADSAKALEDQELEEAARHAGEFADGATGPEGDTVEPEQSIAEGADGVVDPEIWLDAFSDEPTLDATGGTHPDAQEEPFEDPEMWAEAFADQAAHTPEPDTGEPDTGEPAVELEPQDDEAMIDPADAWAEMFAEETPADNLWDKAVAESEIVPEPAAQEETPADPPQPQEVPPGKPEEVPPEPEKAPPPPPKEVPPPPSEVPPQPKEDDEKKSMSDLESELERVEAQRRQLKKQRSRDEPKESEEQRLMQELERQQEDGEAYRNEMPASELADTVATEPPEVEAERQETTDPTPAPSPVEAVSPPETDDDLPVVDMQDDDLDVIGLDEELADQEKEVIGLDEEFARANAGSSPYQPASAEESGEASPEVEIDRDETRQDEEPVASAERAQEPMSEDVVHEESREEPKKKTSAAEQFASTPLQPELSALENLSTDFSESSRQESEDAEALPVESAMFDDLGAGMEDWGVGSEDAPAGSSTATLASEEPDDFTAAFFGQSGQPDLGSGAEPQKTPEAKNTAPNTNWTDSLGDEEDEGLTKEEMWEREFPVLGEDEEGDPYGEEESEDEAAVAVNADDPFSDVSDHDDYQDEDYPDEEEDARPVVIDSEYGDGYEDEEGFEGVDESAYEDYDEEEDDYELAFQPRKMGPFSVPHGRKGNLIVVSVVVGLLLLAGTGYFIMQTFTPDELTDFMVADGDIPEDMVPHENTGTQPPPVTTNPEMQELLSETEAEQQLDIDELMDTTGPIQSQPEPEPETVVAEKTPAPQPGEKLEEATKLLEPSEDNELLKELEQSQILQESQQEIEQAVKQEEKLAELIDPNATIVAFNTILPVAYNTTDIRVLSFRLEIEMDTVDGANVIRKAMPIYEDMMISTVEGFFQQRFYTDVVYAKEKLRDKLREVFNKSLNNGKIQKANFTDFAIQ